MDYHSFPERIVKTRKHHFCWGCGSKIERGTSVLKQSGVHVGEGFFNGYFCEKCTSFIKTASSFDWGDYTEGLFMGDLKEHDDYNEHIVTPLSQITLK